MSPITSIQMGQSSYITRDVHLDHPTPFHLNITPTTATPAYPIKYNPEGVIVPYTHEEKSTIDVKFSIVKIYFKTWKNIYRACYDTLDAHVNNAFKVAPPTTPQPQDGMQQCPSTIFFDLFATTYRKPTPDTMHQNNLTILAVYNQQDPPKILFKRCTNCQEIATLAQNPYTIQQLLLNSPALIA
jgi:hypothetical protein